MIDAHVHFWTGPNGTLFDSIWFNFERQRQALQIAQPHYALLWAKSAYEVTANEEWIESLHSKTDWRAGLDYVVSKAHQRITVLCGQQLVDDVGLEFLYLGQDTLDYESISSADLLSHRAHTDALIVPWGFGKWLFKRGNVIDAMLPPAVEAGHCLIGDIPARVPFLNGRSFFSGGYDAQLLRGSDPLPIKGGPKTIGTYGTVISLMPGEIERSEKGDTPAPEMLRQVLQSMMTGGHSRSVQHFGRRHSLFTTLCDQVRLRLAK